MTEVGEGRLYLVTPAEYATLYDGGAKDGTVTSNGVTYAWDDNAVYAQIPQFGTGLDLDEDYLITLAAATEFSLGGVMAAVPWDATATLPVQINESGAMYVDALSTAAAAASFISAVTAYSGTSKTLSLAVTKNGATTNVTVPYATNAMYGTDSSGQSDERAISYEYIHKPAGSSYTDEAYAAYVPEQAASASYFVATSVTNDASAIPTAAAVYAFASQAGSLVVSTSSASATPYYLMGVSTLTSASSQTVYDYSGVYMLNSELYSGGAKVLTGITTALVNAVGTISNDTTGNAATATKLGTSTVGGVSRPIYLNAGAATALSSTVGSGTSPIYLSSGTITASTSTVGGATTAPVYLNAGTLAAVTSIPYSLLTGTPTIPTVTNYYWANINISVASSTTTSPTFSTATATTFYGSLSGNATSATELSNVSYSSSTMTLTLF